MVRFRPGFGDENRDFRAGKSDQKPGFGGEKRAFRAWKPDQKPGFPMHFGEKAENKPTIKKRNRAVREEKSSFSRRFQRRGMRREGTQATISLTFTHPV